MKKKDLRKLREKLNKEAEKTFLENETLFLVGASRLFETWAQFCTIAHVKTETDVSGDIVSWESCPRYLPYTEMLKVFPNIKEWATREQSEMEEISVVMNVFHDQWSQIPQSQEEVETALDDITVGETWKQTTNLFFECLLQSLLQQQMGWGKREVSLWCDQENDSPSYDALFEKLAEITPEQAQKISRSQSLEAVAPETPPYARMNGWMPSFEFSLGDVEDDEAEDSWINKL